MGFAGLVILLLAFQLRLLHPPARSTSFVAAGGADDANPDFAINALITAIRYDQPDAVLLLLQYALPNMGKYLGDCITPLQFAVDRKALATLKVLLKRADVNELDCNRRSALMHAALVGSKEIMEELLKAGANATFANSAGYTVAHHAALLDRFEVMKVLLDHDKSLVRARNVEKETPFHIATHENYVSLAKLMLKYDPVDDEEDAWGNTPLTHAVHNRQKDLIAMILKNRENSDLKPRSDEDKALRMAKKALQFEIAELLEQAAAKRIQDKKEAEDAEIVSLTEQAGPISIEHNLRHQKN